MTRVKKQSETSQWVEATEDLWLTADRERVVPADDRDAASLLATAGKRLSVEEAERYGLIRSKADEKQEEPAEDKQAEKPADKQRRTSSRKRAS